MANEKDPLLEDLEAAWANDEGSAEWQRLGSLELLEALGEYVRRPAPRQRWTSRAIDANRLEEIARIARQVRGRRKYRKYTPGYDYLGA